MTRLCFDAGVLCRPISPWWVTDVRQTGQSGSRGGEACIKLEDIRAGGLYAHSSATGVHAVDVDGLRNHDDCSSTSEPTSARANFLDLQTQTDTRCSVLMVTCDSWNPLTLETPWVMVA